MNNDELSNYEMDAYRAYILVNLGRAYRERDLVMQIHMAALRSVNTLMYNKLGVDTGFDCSHDINVASATAKIF